MFIVFYYIWECYATSADYQDTRNRSELQKSNSTFGNVGSYIVPKVIVC